MSIVSSGIAFEIGDVDSDWWSNNKKYLFGPISDFSDAHGYDLFIIKTQDQKLFVRLKVPGGMNEAIFDAPIVAPDEDKNTIRVSLYWGAERGFVMEQNGKNTQHVPYPAPRRSQSE